jgi:hypothetical protein
MKEHINMKFLLCSLSFFTFFSCFGSQNSLALQYFLDNRIKTEQGTLLVIPVKDLAYNEPHNSEKIDNCPCTHFIHHINCECNNIRRTIYECSSNKTENKKADLKFYILAIKKALSHKNISSLTNKQGTPPDHFWTCLMICYLGKDVNHLRNENIRNMPPETSCSIVHSTDMNLPECAHDQIKHIFHNHLVSEYPAPRESKPVK